MKKIFHSPDGEEYSIDYPPLRENLAAATTENLKRLYKKLISWPAAWEEEIIIYFDPEKSEFIPVGEGINLDAHWPHYLATEITFPKFWHPLDNYEWEEVAHRLDPTGRLAEEFNRQVSPPDGAHLYEFFTDIKAGSEEQWWQALADYYGEEEDFSDELVSLRELLFEIYRQ